MILDTISFLLLTYISLCSFIGFGFLTNHILFKESISGNIFNFSTYQALVKEVNKQEKN